MLRDKLMHHDPIDGFPLTTLVRLAIMRGKREGVEAAEQWVAAEPTDTAIS